MRIIDLSQPVFDHCPTNPAKPGVRSEIIADHERGGFRVEQLTLTSHTGSHIDAPLHKRPDGKPINELPLELFMGKALVADLRDSRPGMPFTSSWLTRRLRMELEGSIILLGTGWGQKRDISAEWLTRGPFLTPDGAHWLVEQEIIGVCIDCHSMGGVREPQNSTTHDILSEAGIWVAEDLLIPDEVYELERPATFCGFPINLQGFSAGFCRPVLMVEEDEPSPGCD